jgi:hypothetical protein
MPARWRARRVPATTSREKAGARILSAGRNGRAADKGGPLQGPVSRNGLPRVQTDLHRTRRKPGQSCVCPAPTARRRPYRGFLLPGFGGALSPARALNGESCAVGVFTFADFGLRISRFPFCCPLAMHQLPRFSMSHSVKSKLRHRPEEVANGSPLIRPGRTTGRLRLPRENQLSAGARGCRVRRFRAGHRSPSTLFDERRLLP